MIKNSEIKFYYNEMVIYDTDKDNFEMIILKGSANLYQSEEDSKMVKLYNKTLNLIIIDRLL
jgi:hypothetical protein